MRASCWSSTAGLLALALAAGAAFPEEVAAKKLQGAILIVLDTARPDRLSAYGYERRTTPALEGIVERGVLFENAISSSPWTLPSMASLLSGRWVEDALDPYRKLEQSVVESFRKDGFATAAFTEGGYVSRYFDFNRGFTDYREEQEALRPPVSGRAAEPEGPTFIEETFAAASTWLVEHSAERFFLLIHTYEAHTPYRRHHFTQGLPRGRLGETFEISDLSPIRSGKLVLDPDEVSYVSALYDGGLFECDRQIATLQETLEATGLDDRTLVVVTSDHGEELGEHFPSFVADHGHSLRDNLLRVPLIIVNPAESYAVKRVREQARLVDVLPTVAEILGVRVDVSVDGRSLVPLMRGGEGTTRAVHGSTNRAGPARSFLRTPEYKYIEVDPTTAESEEENLIPGYAEFPRRQLYDLRVDPGEKRDVSAERTDVANQLSKQLSEVGHPARGPLVHDLPDEMRERLRSLGYFD